jgi:Uma2 family endonuclease
MTVTLHEPWTVERFLAWEDKQEGRHEFDGTYVIEMTGGSRAHQRIAGNLLRCLEDRLDLEQFDVVQEMRINTGGKIRYPDITVCAGRIPDRIKTLRDAIVTFEVLSDETADIDQNDKRLDYANIPSLRRYIILDQFCMSVSVIEKLASGWTETTLNSGTLPLPELGIELPLDAIYRGLTFSN